MAGRLHRKDRAAQRLAVADDGDPRPFREARRPCADRHQLEPAVLLQPLHLRAQCVHMRDDGPVGAGLTARKVDAHRAPPGQPAVDAARGEALGQGLLVGREHVDGVVRTVAKVRHRACMVRQAPEHQRGRKRHRVERVGREAHQRAVGRARGDDGHAGGEHAQRRAEVARGEVGRPCLVAGGAGRGHTWNLYENS